MATNDIQRNSNLTDPELCMFTSNLCNTMTRDLSDIASFGVSSLSVTNLKALGDAFEIYPSDDMLSGDLMIATQDKNDKLELVKEGIRNMALRVEMKWGSQSGQYRRLGITGMNNMPDDTLLFTSRRVHTVMTGYLTDLAAQGLTQDMLDDFEDLNESFEVAKNEQQDKMNIRDMSTLERINYANELYNLVAHYCDIGKRVYVNSNQAKYNDYIIYTGLSTGMPGKIQNVAYNQTNNQLTWDADPVADTYQLEISSDGNAWSLEYEDVNPNAGIGKPPGTWYARVRGINDKGNGAWSDSLEYTVIIQPPVMIEIIFQSVPNQNVVNFQAVPYANKYEVWHSEVAIGSPAGTFTKIGEPSDHHYNHTSPTPNKRHYYYAIAVSTDYGMSSEPSNTAYDDVATA